MAFNENICSKQQIWQVNPPSVHLSSYLTGGLKKLYRHLRSDCHSIPVYDPGQFTNDHGHFYLSGSCVMASRYRVLHVISTHGQSAVLLMAEDMFKEDEVVVIKVLHRTFSQLGTQETHCLQQLRSADPEATSNTLQLLNIFMFDDHYCMVFEALHPDPINRIFGKIPREKLLPNIRKVAFKLLTVLGFLQQENVIHADLKPDNILLKKKDDLGSLKVIDFGNAIHHVHKEVALYYEDFEVQTPLYRAPEVIFGIPFGSEIDMWSVGCILAELYAGKPLFFGTDENAILDKMTKILGPVPSHIFQRGKFYHRLKHYTESSSQNSVCETLMKHLECRDYKFCSFLAGFLQYNPDKRVKPNEAALHPFLAKELPVGFLIGFHKDKVYPSVYVPGYVQCPHVSSDIQRSQPSSLDLLKIGTKAMSLEVNNSNISSTQCSDCPVAMVNPFKNEGIHGNTKNENLEQDLRISDRHSNGNRITNTPVHHVDRTVSSEGSQNINRHRVTSLSHLDRRISSEGHPNVNRDAEPHFDRRMNSEDSPNINRDAEPHFDRRMNSEDSPNINKDGDTSGTHFDRRMSSECSSEGSPNINRDGDTSGPHFGKRMSSEHSPNINRVGDTSMPHLGRKMKSEVSPNINRSKYNSLPHLDGNISISANKINLDSSNISQNKEGSSFLKVNNDLLIGIQSVNCNTKKQSKQKTQHSHRLNSFKDGDTYRSKIEEDNNLEQKRKKKNMKDNVKAENEAEIWEINQSNSLKEDKNKLILSHADKFPANYVQIKSNLGNSVESEKNVQHKDGTHVPQIDFKQEICENQIDKEWSKQEIEAMEEESLNIPQTNLHHIRQCSLIKRKQTSKCSRLKFLDTEKDDNAESLKCLFDEYDMQNKTCLDSIKHTTENTDNIGSSKTRSVSNSTKKNINSNGRMKPKRRKYMIVSDLTLKDQVSDDIEDSCHSDGYKSGPEQDRKRSSDKCDAVIHGKNEQYARMSNSEFEQVFRHYKYNNVKGHEQITGLFNSTQTADTSSERNNTYEKFLISDDHKKSIHKGKDTDLSRDISGMYNRPSLNKQDFKIGSDIEKCSANCKRKLKCQNGTNGNENSKRKLLQNDTEMDKERISGSCDGNRFSSVVTKEGSASCSLSLNTGEHRNSFIVGEQYHEQGSQLFKLNNTSERNMQHGFELNKNNTEAENGNLTHKLPLLYSTDEKARKRLLFSGALNPRKSKPLTLKNRRHKKTPKGLVLPNSRLNKNLFNGLYSYNETPDKITSHTIETQDKDLYEGRLKDSKKDLQFKNGTKRRTTFNLDMSIDTHSSYGNKQLTFSPVNTNFQTIKDYIKDTKSVKTETPVKFLDKNDFTIHSAEKGHRDELLRSKSMSDCFNHRMSQSVSAETIKQDQSSVVVHSDGTGHFKYVNEKKKCTAQHKNGNISSDSIQGQRISPNIMGYTSSSHRSKKFSPSVRQYISPNLSHNYVKLSPGTDRTKRSGVMSPADDHVSLIMSDDEDEVMLLCV